MNGTEKGKYIFYEELGRGGSGNVYRAYDKNLKCDRAIKKFRAEEGIWEKELEMLKELRHPLLPVITDSMEEGEYRYLVMEYIEGKNLEDYVREKGRIDQELAVKWALELIGALIYLHERNSPIIYRDMKPANIMVDRNEKLRLVDFGTAWMRYREEEEVSLAGTYGYAAPEQLAAEGMDGVDERSDVYGLGATLYYMLTGDDPAKPPFLIQSIRFFDRRLPIALEKVVEKAVAEKKEKRYQTMRQFQADLERYKKMDRIRGMAGKLAGGVYYSFLLGLSILFAKLCSTVGHEDEILLAAILIFALCLIKTGIVMFIGRGKRGMRQERNLFLTEKRGKGLIMLLAGVLCAAAINAVDVSAEEENTLFVNVRNEKGQKLLIRYDAVYPLSEALKLELPLSNFEEGETYRLRLECVNCETEERSSRTFYLKSLEP